MLIILGVICFLIAKKMSVSGWFLFIFGGGGISGIIFILNLINAIS